MDGCHSKRRIGIVGFGSIGKYLVEKISDHDKLELGFVWNRSPDALLGKVEEELILRDLSQFAERKCDLIVEAAHPSIVTEYGSAFLKETDLMVGSPTAFANPSVERTLRQAASHHGLYIATGAFWGGDDIRKMADRGTLQGLKISMTKHPDSFKLCGSLKEKNQHVTSRTILYEGSVRGLCPLAPNNVNTMAAAAIVAHNLGFDKVKGCLISDPDIKDWHIVDIEVWGPGDMESGNAFHVHTIRKNPAKIGSVTGSATYASFLSSLLGAHGRGPGIHLC